jgi:hypothetical protein
VPTALQLADICTKPCAWSVNKQLLPLVFGQPLRFSADSVDSLVYDA